MFYNLQFSNLYTACKSLLLPDLWKIERFLLFKICLRKKTLNINYLIRLTQVPKKDSKSQAPKDILCFNIFLLVIEKKFDRNETNLPFRPPNF